MLRVGLTGGIGSGKSVVATMLATRGAVVIDADVLAREVVEPGTEGYERVVAAFGPEVVGADGRLDRAALGQVVFNNPERLAVLNAIVHPLVAERSADLASRAPEDAVLVMDVPLLVENHLEGAYDVVIVVDAPDDVRLDRLLRVRGMPEEDARARMAAQVSREDRLEAADFVVDNSGALDDLEGLVDALWQELSVAAA